MIRSSIDYSEYEIRRSNFEFWDQLYNRTYAFEAQNQVK